MSVGNSAKEDKSYANRLRFLRGKIAVQRYPPMPAQALATPGLQSPQSEYMTILDGRILATYKSISSGGNVVDPPGCCGCQPVCPVSTTEENTPGGGPVNIGDESFQAFIDDIYGQSTPIPAPPIDYPYSFFIVVFYPIYCNSISQTVQLLDSSGNPIGAQITDLGTPPPLTDPPFPTGLGGVVIIYPSSFDFNNITLTVSNSCSSETGDAQIFCFLAGSPVTLEDGSTKPIETITVGDRVVGAFGEINTVVARQQNPLGLATISNINGEHMTTSHHPHISTDHKFCCVQPNTVSQFAYGKGHWVTVEDGKKERRVMKGVSRDRIVKLEVGMELQTLSGARTVTSIERVPMPYTTPVYHLAVDGSHTYTVDGYAVVGWADETDFDYDAWVPK